MPVSAPTVVGKRHTLAHEGTWRTAAPLGGIGCGQRKIRRDDWASGRSQTDR
jgi:hypothetical protein